MCFSLWREEMRCCSPSKTSSFFCLFIAFSSSSCIPFSSSLQREKQKEIWSWEVNQRRDKRGRLSFCRGFNPVSCSWWCFNAMSVVMKCWCCSCHQTSCCYSISLWCRCWILLLLSPLLSSLNESVNENNPTSCCCHTSIVPSFVDKIVCLPWNTNNCVVSVMTFFSVYFLCVLCWVICNLKQQSSSEPNSTATTMIVWVWKRERERETEWKRGVDFTCFVRSRNQNKTVAVDEGLNEM